MTMQRRLGDRRLRALLGALLRARARGTARRRARPRGGRRASGRARPGPARPRCGRCRRPDASAAAPRTTASVRPSTVSRTLRRGRALRAVDGEERLHHRDRDLVRLERHDGAVAANDLVALVRRRGRRRAGPRPGWKPERRRSPGRWLLAWIPLWSPGFRFCQGALCHAPEPLPTLEKLAGGALRDAWPRPRRGKIQDTARNTISGVWARNNHYL